jgi:hypothetical protein
MVGATTLATPGPARAAAPPAVSVLSTTCDGFVFANAVGAAADARGRLHGFAGYESSSCGKRIYYFEGAGTSWTTRSTSLVGSVVDVAQDTTGTYLLYVINELSGSAELAVARRAPDGTITRLAIVAPVSGTAQGQRGSIVARGGKWLAVWSQGNGTATDNDLYQFGTLYGSPGTSSPVAIGSGNDMAPALTFAPDGAVILAFTRTQSTGKVVRVARTTNGGTWSWRTAGSSLPIDPYFASLDLAVTSAGTFVSWTERVDGISQMVVADDLTGSWRRQRPPAVYDSANWDGSIVASGAKVLAGYSSGDEYPNDTVNFAKRTTATGAWTEVPADPAPGSIDSKGVAGVFLFGSAATALVASGDRLYAINGLTL